MKKLILGALIIGALAFGSCGNDDDDLSSRSCETLEQNVQDAFMRYSEDASVKNCNSYRALLQAQIDKNCLDDGGAVAQKLLNNLNCI